MTGSAVPDLCAGVYRHYKGPLYLVLGYAHDANDADRVVVVYVGLQLDEAHEGARLAVRTDTDFRALVCGFAGCPAWGRMGRIGGTASRPYCRECGHAAVRRFTYVGPTWEGS